MAGNSHLKRILITELEYLSRVTQDDLLQRTGPNPVYEKQLDSGRNSRLSTQHEASV